MAIFKKEHEEMPAPTAARPRSDAAGAPGSRTPSTIGRNLRISGEITGDEDLQVDGTVEGKVNISKTLTIGQTGNIKADVHGETVVVIGRVNGNISATGKVILKPTANVTGNITCASFIVNEGAGFEGNINMKQPEQAVTRPAAEIPPKPAR